MARRTKPDSLSMALFNGTDLSAENAHQPGFSDVQQLAATSAERAILLNQPMQSIALRPTHGAITRTMSLMWLKIIQVIQKQPEAPVYLIPMKELVDFIGDTKNYDRLKENLKALNAVQVEWNAVSEHGEQWAVSSLLSQAKVTRAGGTTTVEVSLPPDINKGVREMKQFSTLNLMLARELKNPAALNLFRIAVAYETNPSRVTFRKPVGEWELLLRSQPRPPGTDFVYKYFKRDTVLPAMAEIARLTHLTLELIEHREGRVVRQLQFRVLPKESIDLEPASESVAEADALASLKALGVRTAEARAMVASFGADRVRRNVEYLRKKQAEGNSKVRNETAYIKAAIQSDYADRELEEGDITVIAADPVSKKGLTDAAADRELAMQGFQAYRRAQVQALFMEMPYRESNQHWEEFVDATKAAKNQTLLAAIKSKGMKAKLVQIAFYDWLSERLLGAITDQSFLEYLVTQQAAVRAAPKASRKRAAEPA